MLLNLRGGTKLLAEGDVMPFHAQPAPYAAWARRSHPAGIAHVPVSWSAANRIAGATELEVILL